VFQEFVVWRWRIEGVLNVFANIFTQNLQRHFSELEGKDIEDKCLFDGGCTKINHLGYSCDIKTDAGK